MTCICHLMSYTFINWTQLTTQFTQRLSYLSFFLPIIWRIERIFNMISRWESVKMTWVYWIISKQVGLPFSVLSSREHQEETNIKWQNCRNHRGNYINQTRYSLTCANGSCIGIKFDMSDRLFFFGDPLLWIALHICESCGFQIFMMKLISSFHGWEINFQRFAFSRRERFHPLRNDIDLRFGEKKRQILKFDMFF